MRAGNGRYEKPADLPARIPVFPLSGALLLPAGQMPLNIFEPRYLAMIDHAMATDRIIGMVQPRLNQSDRSAIAQMADIGCAGRIVQFAETGDGRYLITLGGICRFRILEEADVDTPFRQCNVSAAAYGDDFNPKKGEDAVDRKALLQAFRNYLVANDLEADWESVNEASNASLVTALAMMAPAGPAEKQALLEACDHKSRAELLIAITEIALAGGSESSSSLQ
ncbi:MAG: LON peptidase substrate-binding domain-containing protein [Hyphomicrobiales bacterium]|nr:LON peptidase substrate-binding domain-containing protein [Hyphomicrobiales bacterium]